MSSIPELPAYNAKPLLEWSATDVTAAAPRCRSLGRYDPVAVEELPPHVPYSAPTINTGTAWGLAVVAMVGVAIGFMGYFVTAKHIAPVVKAPPAQQVADAR